MTVGGRTMSHASVGLDDDVDERIHTVLIVDDEAMTVSALKHQLRRRYHVLGTTSATEGLAMLAENDVAVVLCDERMPGMQGHEFLAAVSARWPETVRILVTAYADLPALVRAVNHGQIFAYLSKPWNAEELERVVEKAVGVRALMEDKRRVEEELHRTNADLKRVVSKLREFTHAIAHDLQEPLRTVTAYASFLDEELGEQIDPEQRRFLSGISRCSGHMRALIDDLLLFSELERLPVTLATVPMEEVVRQAVALLDAMIQDRGAVIEVNGPLPVVKGDLNRLVLLFQNLLSNGLKFNTSTPPRVVVEPTPAAGGRAAVLVRDNGIGISAEHFDRIFQIFHRLHSKREYPGTGAGLAIARQIVEVHGGALTLTSEVGEGTTFRVELLAAE